jgi:hypothetical protein
MAQYTANRLEIAHGVTVRIVRLLEALAVDAVKTGKEQIEMFELPKTQTTEAKRL